MAGLLATLSLDEAIGYIENHLATLLLSGPTCACFASRLANDPGLAGSDHGRELLVLLMRRYLEIVPFSAAAVDVARHLLRDESLGRRLELLRSLAPNSEEFDRLAALPQGLRRQYVGLLGILDRNPGHLEAAQMLLALDARKGRPSDAWLDKVRCPEELQPEFNRLIFLQLAGLGLWERALNLFSTPELYPAVADQELGPYTLNLAGHCFRMAGDTALALDLYARSLEQDPRQAPVALLMKELADPTPPRPDLIGQRKVAIFLYSWNKADMLRRTLEGLAASDIGPARISVLLNGCTDHSAEVVREAAARFPDNDFEVIELPVNIGAPAARNWLINRERTWSSDYVAFLDDDVDVPADWLARFLAAMEANPRCGVVGGKAVDPGEPAKLQYLHRRILVAKPGQLKMNVIAPLDTYDLGQYDYQCRTRSVMGCLHLFRTDALREAPLFDIRFSPSQVDDIEHDLQLNLKGWEVVFCGLVTCVHHQSSGLRTGNTMDPAAYGSIIGNDLKLCFKYQDRMDELAKLDAVSLLD